VNLVRLALRNVLAGRPRAWPALVTVAAAVCALDLAGGGALTPGSTRAEALAWRAVVVAALVVVAATVAATATLQGVARRRELATLRALGMCKLSLVLLLELEALWITLIGTLLGLVVGSLMAWVANRSALVPACGVMLCGLGAVLCTAALAALVPAIGAARHEVARGLAVLPAHPDC
jgi:putative ABC transport system permease protein